MMVLLTAACESAEDRRERLIAEGRACSADDECVLAGDSDCTCAVPVNKDKAAEIDAAADEIQCCTVLGQCTAVECAAFANIRCDDGACVGD
jgi:hypothetical protein